VTIDSASKLAAALNFSQMDDVLPFTDDTDDTVDARDRWQVAGFYSISSSSIKLAQIFSVNDQFVPTKASVFLRPRLNNEDHVFLFSDNVSIDSLNFSSLSQGTNKMIADDSFAGFSGGGYLSVDVLDGTGGYASVSYPIQASSGQYRLWLRSRTSTGAFMSVVSLDGTEIGNIDNLSATAFWEWNSLLININDTNAHTLEIQPTINGSFIDKIYITSDVDEVVSGAGPDFSIAPYVTVHARLYTVDGNNRPSTPLFIYDYITTVSDLKTDDWYNFNLNFLDSSRAISFSDSYALVLYSSGSSSDKYVVWEITDADEDVDSPSAIKA
jgi:hypothetical protein